MIQRMIGEGKDNVKKGAVPMISCEHVLNQSNRDTQLSFDAHPHYLEEDLIIFDVGYDEHHKIDTAISRLKDPSVRAEVHHYRSASGELDHLEQLLINLKAKWGELATQKLGVIRRLEMANAMACIEEVQQDEVDMEVHHGRRP